MTQDVTTETAFEGEEDNAQDRILAVSRRLFAQKGFKETTMRDIAKEANTNLAMVNYYYRSKDNLYEVVMSQHLQQFGAGIGKLFNDESTTIQQKIERVASIYIDMLLANPSVPLFIMSQIRTDPERFMRLMNAQDLVLRSVFMKQHREEVEKGNMIDLPPSQIMMNILGLIVFPFIAQPMIQSVTGTTNEEWEQQMQRRKSLVPTWINTILRA